MIITDNTFILPEDIQIQMMVQYPHLNEEEIFHLARARYDPCYFCEYFFADEIKEELPWFHRAMFAILLKRTDFLKGYKELDRIVEAFVDKHDELDIKPFFIKEGDGVKLNDRQHVVFMIPRGFAKTTIICMWIIYSMVFKDRRHIVYASETEGHAENQVEGIKRRLATNDRIKHYFGELIPKKNDFQRNTKGFFETFTKDGSGTILRSRGRGAQIRGMNEMGDRPCTIILDDVQDETSVRTEEQRNSVVDWFFAAVVPALAEMKAHDPKIVCIGTLLHREALLAKLQTDESFMSVVLASRDQHGQSIWPSLMSNEKLDKKRQILCECWKARKV